MEAIDSADDRHTVLAYEYAHLAREAYSTSTVLDTQSTVLVALNSTTALWHGC